MSNLHVAILTPETAVRQGIRRTLTPFTVPAPEGDGVVGFTFEEFAYGRDAIDWLTEHKPDLLLLDQRIPDLGWTVVLTEVRKHEDVRIIMLTSLDAMATAIEATRQGADDFLPKPFTPADLKHAVRKAATHLLLARRARELEAERKNVRFEFIRVLGHELKAPISAVAGYLYLLRDKTLGNEIEKYDAPVERSLDRLEQMRKLIIDLLDMTRLESGQKRRELGPVHMNAAVGDARELVSVAAGERNITFTCHVPDDLWITADRGEIDMMLNNLISNAVKYNRDEGEVIVDVTYTRGVMTVAVTDTGFGMTEEEAGKLFGEFVRLKGARQRNIAGSGLGLSILKRLTQLYGGDVSVKSQPDVGSTFTAVLKVQASGPETSEEATT
jgi:two-component system sensor histidine kinase/response regulator